jgi:mediator of RNA polymerase II transcription subunit 12, fungi type
VASGLRRIVEVLVDPATSVDDSMDSLYWANEVLRAILYMAGPSDNEALFIPDFEPILHELLLGAMHKKLVAIDQITSSEYDGARVIPALVIILRLLQLTLGFRGSWTVKAKEEGVSISVVLFRFVLVRSLSPGTRPL